MFCLQRLGLPLVVDGGHSELVLVSGDEVLQLGLGVLGLGGRHPAPGLRVQLLDEVVVDGRAAIVQRRTPLQRATFLVHVRYLRALYFVL